jgi:hypothetical protein
MGIVFKECIICIDSGRYWLVITILLVNVLKRKMMNFSLIQKRKVSNSRAIGNFYFEVEGEKTHFYWKDLQVRWYK